jgi:hypothetical protein
MANIFNIDWDNVVENLTPWFWRETASGTEHKLLPYLRSMIAPVQDISDDLLTLNTETIDFLKYTGQHKALEEYLNDTYDVTLRRIFITENDIAGIDSVNIYQSGEAAATTYTIYQSGEVVVAPIAFYQSGEGITADNFTVNIPVTIITVSALLTAQLRNYVKASKNWNVVTF